MINEALGFYVFSDPSIKLIRHNENMTYRIGGKYLLRIHKPTLCREMGVMMAKLHSAAKSFPPFPAMSYDVKLCERLVRKMNEAKEAGFIDSDYCAAISSALSIIGKFLLESNDESIIVHSDLSLSNMLITPSGLAPIDFFVVRLRSSYDGYQRSLLRD